MERQGRNKKPIFLIGFMGSGKSTMGHKLSRILKYRFIDLDQFLIRKHELSIGDLFARFGEEGFRRLEREALQELAEEEGCIIACGGGTPCYADNMQMINEKGTTIYLQTDLEVLFQRLKTSATERPLLAGKSEEELRETIESLLNIRKAYYEQAKYHIDGNRPDPERLIALIKIG